MKLKLSIVLAGLCLSFAANAGDSVTPSKDFLSLKELFEKSSRQAHISDFQDFGMAKAVRCASASTTGDISEVAPYVIYRAMRKSARPENGPLFPAQPAVTEPVVAGYSEAAAPNIEVDFNYNNITETIVDSKTNKVLLRTTMKVKMTTSYWAEYPKDYHLYEFEFAVNGPYVTVHTLRKNAADNRLIAEGYGYCWTKNSK